LSSTSQSIRLAIYLSLSFTSIQMAANGQLNGSEAMASDAFQPGALSFTTLYAFQTSGTFPTGPLVIDSGGVLYGMTGYPGATTPGTVFSLTPPTIPGAGWTEMVLWNFGGSGDGSHPAGGLVLGSGGVLYGSTSQGGQYNRGMVFSLTPPAVPGGSWVENILWILEVAATARVLMDRWRSAALGCFTVQLLTAGNTGTERCTH